MGFRGSGSTSTTIQFVQGLFVEDYHDLIWEDAYRKQVKIDDEHTVVLDVLDISSAEEEFPNGMIMHYLRIANGFLVLFSLTDHNSFHETVKYLEMIQQVKEDDTGKLPIVLVGNKSDLVNDRVVSRNEALDFARESKVKYMEISAKTNENVTECFLTLTRMMMEMYPQTQDNGQKRCMIQ